MQSGEGARPIKVLLRSMRDGTFKLLLLLFKINIFISKSTPRLFFTPSKQIEVMGKWAESGGLAVFAFPFPLVLQIWLLT